MDLVGYLKHKEANCLHFYYLSHHDEILTKFNLSYYIYLDNHEDKENDSNYAKWLHPRSLRLKHQYQHHLVDKEWHVPQSIECNQYREKPINDKNNLVFLDNGKTHEIKLLFP